jgi:hypothetical protein
VLCGLGMKRIWNEKEPEDLFNTWSALLEEYNKEIKSVRIELQAHGYFEELRFGAFSDMIVISLPVKHKVVRVDRGRNPSLQMISSLNLFHQIQASNQNITKGLILSLTNGSN